MAPEVRMDWISFASRPLTKIDGPKFLKKIEKLFELSAKFWPLDQIHRHLSNLDSAHRHLSNIDCLMTHTACLVCFISTVNGRSKKGGEMP